MVVKGELVTRCTVEKYAGCFCHALSQPSWALSLKVKLPLRYRLAGDDVARVMLLNGIGDTDLKIASLSVDGVHPRDVVARHLGLPQSGKKRKRKTKSVQRYLQMKESSRRSRAAEKSSGSSPVIEV